MGKLKLRPRIIPQSETEELSAVFRRKAGKRAVDKSTSEGWGELPTTDEAAKESVRAPKINLIEPVMRFVRSIANVEQISLKLSNLYPKFRQLFEKFTQPEWSSLVEKGLRFLKQSADGFVYAVKGRFLELSFYHSQKLSDLQKLMEHRVKQFLGPSKKWHPEVKVITESYSVYQNGRKLFADFLLVVFDDVKNPTRAWIVAVVESKSESNAIELVSYGSRPDIPDSGEFLGQLHLRSEQFDSLEIDMPGYGKFKRGDNLYCGMLRKGHTIDAPWTKEDTAYYGVIPPDTDPSVRHKIETELANQNFRLLEHENITGKEATQIARSFVDTIPLLDALSK